MPIVVPIIFVAALLAAFMGTGRHGLRQSFVYATVVYTLGVVLTNELLSIWRLLRFEVLLGVWTGLTVLAALYLRLQGGGQQIRQALGTARKRFLESRVELLGLGLALATVLLIAVVAPPNNWDSMVYHMSRVARWVQEGSIEFFTAIHRQNYSAPLAEWNIFHLQVLSGGDRFANTVQWMALVGCGVVSSLTARELGQSFRVQVLAAIAAVTLPMGLLQASSTQNDLFAAFWLAAFALLAIQYLHEPSLGRLAFCGCALGFALLSKGTAYVAAPPLAAMLLLYGSVKLRGSGYRPQMKLAGAAAAVLAVALLLNGGHYARTASLHGFPLYVGVTAPHHTEEHVRNERVNLIVTSANLIRGAALHVRIPNRKVQDIAMRALRRVVGEIDDIGGASDGHRLFDPSYFRIQEDNTGNPLHFVFLSASLVGVAAFRKRLGLGGLTAWLMSAVVLGVISYSALLAWNFWTVRHHISFFMLGAPVTAVFTARLALAAGARADVTSGRCFGRQRKIVLRWAAAHGVRAAAWTFLLLSVPWLLFNETRQIYETDSGPGIQTRDGSIFTMDRTEMYFNVRPHSLQPYVEAVDYLAQFDPKEIGLHIGGNVYEYPLWVLLKERTTDMPRLRHIGIRNTSRILADRNFAPQYIISSYRQFSTFEGESWQPVRVFGELAVLKKSEQPAAHGRHAGAIISIGAPVVGQPFRVKLPYSRSGSDPQQTDWRWERSGGAESEAWTAIAKNDGRSNRYTPTDDDVGRRLRAYTFYKDVEGRWIKTITDASEPVLAR